MKLLRKAAAELLEELRARGELHDAEASPVQIDRLTCEVRGALKTELVSLRVEDGRLQVLCTCGERACAHASAALQLVAADGSAGEITAKHPRRRAELEHAQVDRDPRLPSPLTAATAARLADALTDVVTAVVRAGVCSVHVASVHESLSRVERALPPPLPLGLLRWLGRMREAIDTQDTALAAQALSAAVAISGDLRGDEAGLQPGSKLRLSSWFGGGTDALPPLSDQSLVEIAREWLHGTARYQIERRYLIDLESGDCYREEYARGDRVGSIGSCPRLVGVSLAEVEPSCGPRRLRLLQYTTTPNLERTHWDSVARHGTRDSELLVAQYRAAIEELGALAEPFALAAPRAFQTEGRPSLLFERGAPLPLFTDDEPGVSKRCERLLRTTAVGWVAGRLLEHAGQLTLRPLALGLQDGSGWRYERL